MTIPHKTLTIFNIRPQGFNVGNHVISLALHHFVQEAFGRVVNFIALPAISRYETKAKAGLSKGVIHEINQYGDGVIVGGGNLYENNELAIDLNALDTLAPPLMMFSISKGRIYNRRDELVTRTDTIPDRALKAVNQKAAYSLARDEATLAELKRLGIDHAEMGGCPTIFLNRIANRLPPLPEIDEGATFISIRTPDLMNISLKRQAKTRREILDIVAFLKSEGHDDIRILCHDLRDLAFASSLEELPYHYTGDSYAYLALLRGAKLVVSYRLHATLPCLSYGVPVIPISYDERALSALKGMGMGAWNINMVTEDAVSRFKDRYKNLDNLENIVEKAQKTAWAKLDEVMKRSLKNFAADVFAYHDNQP